MDQIICGARHCAYNMSGACSAGVVRMAEAVSASGGTPYCGTFTRERAPSNTLSVPPRGRDLPQNRSLCCGMLRCVHNARGLCENLTPEILPPHPAESTFAPCGSYERKVPTA